MGTWQLVGRVIRWFAVLSLLLILAVMLFDQFGPKTHCHSENFWDYSKPFC